MVNYLDNCATTKVYDEVIQTIAEVMKNNFGNPSSLHRLGYEADKILKNTREIIAEILNADKDEIIFTSGASEGNNQILKSFGDRIISTEVEHPSVIKTLVDMKSNGKNIILLKPDGNGQIDLDEFRKALNKDILLVSIMMVNNEIGTIYPIEDIGKIIKESGFRAKFHVDATQAFLKFPIDVKRMNIDFLTSSAHKFHGPKGIGFMYIRKGLRLEKLINGGTQEGNLRAGTHNVPYIAGMGKACELMKFNMENNLQHVSALKEQMIRGLSDFKNLKINSPENSSPYILNISLVGLRSEIILRLLEDKEVYVSTGSACSAKNMKDSHVLTSIGLKKEEIKSSIRICFSDTTTEEEVINALEAFRYAVNFAGRIV